jgi:PII-like signaling protein
MNKNMDMKKVAKKEVQLHEKAMHKGKKMANGGAVMKYADGGMAGGCGHRGAQDYGKK